MTEKLTLDALEHSTRTDFNWASKNTTVLKDTMNEGSIILF